MFVLFFWSAILVFLCLTESNFLGEQEFSFYYFTLPCYSYSVALLFLIVLCFSSGFFYWYALFLMRFINYFRCSSSFLVISGKLDLRIFGLCSLVSLFQHFSLYTTKKLWHFITTISQSLNYSKRCLYAHGIKTFIVINDCLTHK